ncbi:MAG: D-alanyl-D-alanine carboxypeptidase/D-alanyl-D-alanine-endopeptidase, partial [Sphingobacteriales bacterium]
PLDTINHFFLRKSINLYGEALLKVLALEKNGYADTETGVELLKAFWASKGIHKNALNISDGSGLSPQNRVTTRALVQALQYASKQKWFASFYNALPEYNGMKIKSGSINGCRSFAGYHTSKSGTHYTVAIIVNNYNSSSSSLIKKIYQVLDVLK